MCVAGLVVAISAAACGGGAKDNGIAKLSATDALKQVQAAVKEVDTVHISGHLTAQGQDITLDLRDKAGAGVGTLRLAGGEIDVVRTSDTIYVKGNATALTAFGASQTQASVAADKWLRESISSSGPLSAFAQLLDSSALFDSVTTPTGELKTGTTTTINGHKVFTLVDAAAGGNGTLYVAETGDPLPLRVDQPGANGGSLDFEYGVDVSVTAPTGAIDLSQLTGG